MARVPRLSTGERWRIVFFRTEMHLQLKQIAKRMRCSVGEVHRVLSTYYTTNDVVNVPRGRRAGHMSEDHVATLDRIITSNPRLTSTALVNEMTRRTGTRYAASTLRTYRHSILKYHAVHERIRERLTAAHMAARVAFAQSHIHNNFRCVGFSDEKCFILKNTGNVVYIKKGQRIPAREVKNVKAIVWVWGCIWYNGRTTLHTQRNAFNIARYINTLTNHLLPSWPTSTRFLFMQNGASWHTSPQTRTWLTNNAIHVLPNWPAHSPELNAIEYVWNWMTAFVKQEAPNDRTSLKRAIRLAWQQLPQSTIRECVDHIPVACRAVIAANGAHI